MTAVDAELGYPLTPLQQGMLFHRLAGLPADVDVEQIVCTLREEVDIPALRSAWRWVVARHAALRTSFAWEELDAPRQVVHGWVEIPLSIEDWRGRDPTAQQALLEDMLAADRGQGFSLDSPPLARLNLIRLADADFRLVWTFPHLLLDGRSFTVVLREALLQYDALRAGASLELPEPHPYAEYLQWLHRRDGSRDETFWRARLHGVTTPTPLPSDAPDDRTEGRGERELLLPATATPALEAFARECGVTLSTLVQAAWALLLARHADADDIVFGATLAGRRWAPQSRDAADAMVGLFINTVPVRALVSPDASLGSWLAELRAQQIAARPHEAASLIDVKRWSAVPATAPLFESLLVFDDTSLDAEMRAQGGPWLRREFRLIERTSLPLTLYACARPVMRLRLAYERHRFRDAAIERLLGQLATLLLAMPGRAAEPLRALPVLPERERRRLLVEWNETATAYPRDARIEHLVQAQAQRTPEVVAVAAGGRRLTYRELDAEASRLARRLRAHGAGPGTLVGLAVERSAELIVGLLGILKSGAAYVPLDPEYPAARLALMLEDAGVALLVTQRGLPVPGERDLARIDIDDVRAEADESAGEADALSGAAGTATDLAYVIYTSGSTGRPKGVMITHRNVVNLFAGMDARLGTDAGVWLAVTSISFDISALELLWTLTRGFTVVIYGGERAAQRLRSRGSPASAAGGMEYGLFYFAADESRAGAARYRLLLEGARFADRHGLAAVWIPERHFHAFGGLYPNPSVLAAAIATVTERVGIRAGSVVLPLHHPVRVAEEWAVVDTLSGGRVGLSFASGWHPNDFVLRPENYAERRRIMRRDIDVVRRLWRGEAVSFPGPDGAPVELRALPRPVQRELPVWLTAAGSIETFEAAGAMGANLLTHLLGQTIEELAAKIDRYRAARQANGHDPHAGRVTLMLHTFLGEDEREVRETVRGPLSDYLRTSVDLIRPFAASFLPFRHAAGASAAAPDLTQLDAEDLEALVAHAFERYYETSGLFGTVQHCAEVVERLRRLGVDELACLIDFGVAEHRVLEGLHLLEALRSTTDRAAPRESEPESIGALMRRHGVTHMQCTPSLARMLLDDAETRRALGALRTLLVGGEALPPALAARLQELVSGDIVNMYGPTETTIWSSTYRLPRPAGPISIGRPIANTTFYVVDHRLEPVPTGVPGELLIGGDGVSPGYLGRADLTAERFVPDPFSRTPGARVYRTGDRVRVRDDGTFEFLGRLDDQIKLRGVRAEPGEIQGVLLQHAGVREAVVAARDDGTGGLRLVAYVVPAAGAALDEATLRAFARERLPGPLVPSAFVLLDTLPLTPNKKLDRRSLESPAVTAEPQRPDFVRPRDPLEQRLAAIWERLLDRRPVSVRDDFFELGGHSLLAVTLFSEMQRAFGRRLPLVTLFQAPTIEQLAAVLRRDGCTPAWSSLVALQPAGRGRPLFLVHYNGGHVLHYQPLVRCLGTERPVYGLQARGVHGDQPLQERVEEMASLYLDELRSVQPHGPYHLAGNCFGGLVAFEMACQLRAQGEPVGLLAMLHSAAPMFHANGAIAPGRLPAWIRRLEDRARLAASLPLDERFVGVRRTMGRVRRQLLAAVHPSAGRDGGPARRAEAPPLGFVKVAMRRAERRYIPHTYPGRITVFRAPDLSTTNPAVDLGWGALAGGGVDLHLIPGSAAHDSILRSPLVEPLARELGRCLEAAQRCQGDEAVAI